MRSELFRIPMQLGGVPLFGWGVLLGVLLAAAAVAAIVLLRRGATPRAIAGHAPAVLLCAAILVLLPRMVPGGVPIRGYGLMLLVASVTGIAMAVHRARQHGLPADLIYSLVIWMFVVGIAGARLFFVIEYWETRFATLPPGRAMVEMLMFTEGGLVVYGSLIGGSLAFLVFCLRHKLPPLAMADMIAPSLVAGLAIGRIGCLLNGCCYGGACDAPWAVTFPISSPAYVDQLAQGRLRGIYLREEPLGGEPRVVLDMGGAGDPATRPEVVEVNGQRVASLAAAQRLFNNAYWAGEEVSVRLADGRQVTAVSRSNPVHPTQLYSAVNAALLAWLTWMFYPFRGRDGAVILLLLTLYPISRFVLEQIRVDEAAIFGTGLSISQNVSLGLLAAAAIGWALLLRRPARTHAWNPSPTAP